MKILANKNLSYPYDVILVPLCWNKNSLKSKVMIVNKCWANNYFFLYKSCSMSIKPVVMKFYISCFMKSSVTPVFRTQQCFFYFISNNSTKSKVRSLK